MNLKAPKGVSRIHFFFIYKVWCDVLVWYYDSVSGPIIINDIYGSKICEEFNTTYFPFKLEFKYRYSCCLYDRLKHLSSYSYLNIDHNPPAAIRNSNRGDYLYYSLYRFDTIQMYPTCRLEEVYTEHPTVNYLRESVAQSLHFINS